MGRGIRYLLKVQSFPKPPDPERRFSRPTQMVRIWDLDETQYRHPASGHPHCAADEFQDDITLVHSRLPDSTELHPGLCPNT